MSAIRISHRWAKALIDLAEEQGHLDDVNADIRIMFKLLSSNREFMAMLKSPIIQPEKKLKVFDAIWSDNKHHLILEFLKFLVRKRREPHLRAICRAFIERYNELKHIKPVTITTAQPMSEEVQQRIAQSLRHEESDVARIDLEVEVDPDLIGGYILRYDDKQYDVSVSRNLESMRTEFRKNTYVRGF